MVSSFFQSAQTAGGGQPAQSIRNSRQLSQALKSPPLVGLDWRSQARLQLASNPKTPAEVLDALTVNAPVMVLERVAENPNVSLVTLLRLATDADPCVRAAVTENLRTPVLVLQHLLEDPSPDVRYRMAENHHLPVSFLQVLLEDENPYVSNRAQRTIARLSQLSETMAPPA